MKGFEDERYPVTIKVRITWSDGTQYDDEIKGLNRGHALWRAWWNWEAAELIEVI